MHNSDNIVKKNLFTVTYLGKKYFKSKWYALTSVIYFDPKNIRSKYFPNLHISDLQAYYKQNIRIFTFWGLYFSLFIFLLSSIVISSYYYNHSFIFEENKLFLFFLDLLFLFFTFRIAYKIFFKKERCIYQLVKGKYRYCFIKKETIKKNIDSLNKYYKNQYYYFNPLLTKRLIVREIKNIDIKDYFLMLKNKKVHKYLLTKPIKSKRQVAKFIKEKEKEYKQQEIYHLAIELKENHKVIGYIGLSKYDLSETTCQIIYAISPKYWHKGYTSEAVNIFIEYLRQQGKKLIIGGHVDENINSGKVLLHNGFKRKPALDNIMTINGKPRKIKIYTIDERN